jgi:hypothetical protein
MPTRPTGDHALAANPFDWQVTKAGTVLVFRGGRQIVTVGGKRGDKLAAQLERADERTAQQLLARATGHYKHGNER